MSEKFERLMARLGWRIDHALQVLRTKTPSGRRALREARERSWQATADQAKEHARTAEELTGVLIRSTLQNQNSTPLDVVTYSRIKRAWVENATLIRFPFPATAYSNDDVRWEDSFGRTEAYISPVVAAILYTEYEITVPHGLIS
jgi:hypothetical protein